MSDTTEDPLALNPERIIMRLSEKLAMEIARNAQLEELVEMLRAERKTSGSNDPGVASKP